MGDTVAFELAGQADILPAKEAADPAGDLVEGKPSTRLLKAGEK